VGKLPAPVIPFFGGDILESGSDSGGKFLGHVYLSFSIVLLLTGNTLSIRKLIFISK
jgi:hypothetical protein